MMAARKTYGRLRQRRISVDDKWTMVFGDDKRLHVLFSTSSEDGVTPNSSSGDVGTKNNKKATRNKKRVDLEHIMSEKVVVGNIVQPRVIVPPVKTTKRELTRKAVKSVVGVNSSDNSSEVVMISSDSFNEGDSSCDRVTNHRPIRSVFDSSESDTETVNVATRNCHTITGKRGIKTNVKKPTAACGVTKDVRIMEKKTLKKTTTKVAVKKAVQKPKDSKPTRQRAKNKEDLPCPEIARYNADDSRYNFSDIDKFSLCISDSAPIETGYLVAESPEYNDSIVTGSIVPGEKSPSDSSYNIKTSILFDRSNLPNVQQRRKKNAVFIPSNSSGSIAEDVNDNEQSYPVLPQIAVVERRMLRKDRASRALTSTPHHSIPVVTAEILQRHCSFNRVDKKSAINGTGTSAVDDNLSCVGNDNESSSISISGSIQFSNNTDHYQSVLSHLSNDDKQKDHCRKTFCIKSANCSTPAALKVISQSMSVTKSSSSSSGTKLSNNGSGLVNEMQAKTNIGSVANQSLKCSRELLEATAELSMIALELDIDNGDSNTSLHSGHSIPSRLKSDPADDATTMMSSLKITQTSLHDLHQMTIASSRDVSIHESFDLSTCRLQRLVVPLADNSKSWPRSPLQACIDNELVNEFNLSDDVGLSQHDISEVIVEEEEEGGSSDECEDDTSGSDESRLSLIVEGEEEHDDEIIQCTVDEEEIEHEKENVGGDLVSGDMYQVACNPHHSNSSANFVDHVNEVRCRSSESNTQSYLTAHETTGDVIKSSFTLFNDEDAKSMSHRQCSLDVDCKLLDKKGSLANAGLFIKHSPAADTTSSNDEMNGAVCTIEEKYSQMLSSDSGCKKTSSTTADNHSSTAIVEARQTLDERLTKNESIACGNARLTSVTMAESLPLCTPVKTNTLDCDVLLELRTCDRSVKSMLTPMRLPRSGRLPTARQKVLSLCDQMEPLPFEDFLTRQMKTSCKKIGEGVYGEVFRMKMNKQNVAIKVIPIEGSLPVNDENQKTFDEILSEIVISKKLSALRESTDFRCEDFVDVRRVALLQGQYPDRLLACWDLFHAKKESQNDRPDKFDDNQLYIVFVFGDAGEDLEAFEILGAEVKAPNKISALRLNLYEARSILHQVTCCLAVAECSLEFEHRDLHWGNVLIRRTKECNRIYYCDGCKIVVPTHGVQATIIDFTLSRMYTDQCIVYNADLAVDETYFMGDAKENYQFEIYRMMRRANGNDWKSHCPRTNVMWMDYLTLKLMREKTYEEKDAKLYRKFKSFQAEILSYNSMLQLQQCNFFMDSCREISQV